MQINSRFCAGKNKSKISFYTIEHIWSYLNDFIICPPFTTWHIGPLITVSNLLCVSKPLGKWNWITLFTLWNIGQIMESIFINVMNENPVIHKNETESITYLTMACRVIVSVTILQVGTLILIQCFLNFWTLWTWSIAPPTQLYFQTL